MKAAVWDRELEFVNDYPVPRSAKGEALIRVRVAGICNTDLEIFKGYMGFRGIPGHEFVGVVEDVTGSPHRLKGKRVVGDINCSCGVCSYCLRGMRTHCPHRTTLGISGRNGAFAEYITLPAENLFEVPDVLSDEEAVFAEPLAAAFEIVDQVHVKPTDRALVMGDGKLGLLSALALSMAQAQVTLSGKHRSKMEIARRAGIVTRRAGARPGSREFDIVVEATGRPEGFLEALSHVRPRGTIVLKSTIAERKEIDLTPLVVDEITLQGSRCGPFGPALRAMAMKHIYVRQFISGIYPFSEAKEAFRKAKARGSLKVLIDFRH